MPGVKRSERDADKVDEVVAGEGEGEREGAGENDEGEDVGVAKQNGALHHDEGDAEDGEKNWIVVGFEPGEHLGRHEGSALGALHHEEVNDRRHAERAEDAAENPVRALVVEREEHAHHKLHDKTCDEGDDDRNENRHDHREGLRGIDEEREVVDRELVRPDLEAGEGHRAAKELKDDRNGGRGGEPEGIEDVQKQHVCHHHRRKDHKHFGEGELRGNEHARLGDFHHPRGEGRAGENAHARNGHDHVERCGAGTNRGIDKVHGVVADADVEVENGQKAEQTQTGND